MTEKKYKLQPLEKVSLDVQFSWTMGIIAKLLKITKKNLRKAKKIVSAPKYDDEILINGMPTQITFHYGFYGFIKKIKRKQRKILAPHPKLQIVFRAIKDTLVEMEPTHENAFGFVKKRNVQMAVRSLLGNAHFISFDIADAFPSITAKMVENSLKKLKLQEELIQPLTHLVTCDYDQERRLPQGSSCSPAILNLVYKPMCQEIDRVCGTHNISWFVYADDFNFAALVIPPQAKNELLAIPPKYGFSTKASKTKDNLGKTIPPYAGANNC